MKKLAWFIVGVAALAYIIARKPSTPTPGGDGTGATALFSAPGETDSDTKPSPLLPPDTHTTDAPSPSLSAAVTTPDTTVKIGSSPDDRVDVVEDPPDVVAETRNKPTSMDEMDEISTPAMHVPPQMFRADYESAIQRCEAGDLLLDESGIHFNCPSDSQKNVEVTLAEIRDVDKNGVIDISGKKFHFDIQNANSAQDEKIFRD